MLASAFQHFINAYSGFSRDIWLLTLVNFINRIGGMVVVFLTIYLKDSLGFTLVEAGYILMAYGVGSVLGSYIGGQLTDRFSYFYIQLFSLIGQGAFLMCFLLFDSYFELLAAAFSLSVISDIFRPANTVAYIRYSQESNRTRAFTVARLAFNLGFTLAPALGGLLVPLGWEYLFVVDGMTCWFAAGVLFVYLQPKRAESKEQATKASPTRAGKAAYQNPQFMKMFLLNFFAAMIFMQLIFTVPVFWKDMHGFTEWEVGLLLGFNGLLIALVEMPLIFSIEHKQSKLYFIRLGVLFYALCFALFLPAQVGWVLAALGIVAISFGEIFVMPFTTSYVTQMVSDERQGEYMAMLGISYSIAVILAPWVGTQLADRYSFTVLWSVMIALALALFVAYYFFEKKGTTVGVDKAVVS